MKYGFLASMVAGGVAVAASSSFAALTISTSADAASFAAGAAIVSPTLNNPQAVSTVNQQATAGNSQAQTFVTGAAGFTLDRLVIYSGGKGGADIRLNLYAAPVGGTETDGFVNTSFAADLLGGGAGLTGTVNGSGGTQYITFDLTGADEVTLLPNTRYAIEFDVLATGNGQFSWQRSGADVFGGGNMYVGATGTAGPGGNGGERFQPGGSPQRDAAFALYATVPEPASLGLAALGAMGLIRRRRA